MSIPKLPEKLISCQNISTSYKENCYFFQFTGIMSTDAVGREYLKETNMMFISGVIVAIAVEHSNLHKRVALKVLLLIGTSPRRLMLGFMLPTLFLSMWISNTATTAMMVPIVDAVLSELEREELKDG